MEKEDIYREDGKREEYVEHCIARLHEKDQDTIRKYLQEQEDDGLSIRRRYKIATTLSAISKHMGMAFVGDTVVLVDAKQ